MLSMNFLIEGERVKIVPDKSIRLDRIKLYSLQVDAFRCSIKREADDCMPNRSRRFMNRHRAEGRIYYAVVSMRAQSDVLNNEKRGSHHALQSTYFRMD